MEKSECNCPICNFELFFDNNDIIETIVELMGKYYIFSENCSNFKDSKEQMRMMVRNIFIGADAEILATIFTIPCDRFDDYDKHIKLYNHLISICHELCKKYCEVTSNTKVQIKTN